ncbi:hypothetical protein D9758_012903 [Tetrapyrgos nigripes]|uniref:MYND-type domain-containing protein n=1 Tax=Tetrapyrgos nigripes TaxID=182062 RepID=A0A8H5CM25_9AGAR|nr:hypothetical protein D9758_012903 [Tetrapyrgos nigripes]
MNAGDSPFTERGPATRKTPPIETGACWCYENALRIVEGDRRDEFHKLPAIFRRLRYLIRVYYDFRVTQDRTADAIKYCDFPTVFEMTLTLHKIGLYLQLDLPRLWALMAVGGLSFENFLLDEELDIGPYRTLHRKMAKHLEKDEEADDDDREVVQAISDNAGKDLAVYAMAWFFVDLHVAFILTDTKGQPERQRWAEKALHRLVNWSTASTWKDVLGDPLTDSIRPIYWNKDAMVKFSHAGGLGSLYGDWVNSSCVKLCETTLQELPASAWENQTKTSMLSITRALTSKMEWSDEGKNIVRHPVFAKALFQMYKHHGVAPFSTAGRRETWNTAVLFHFLSHSLKRATPEMQTQLIKSASSPAWKNLIEEYIFLPDSIERRYKWSNLNISGKWDCLEYYGCDNPNCLEKAELKKGREARGKRGRNEDWEKRLEAWGGKSKSCASCQETSYCSTDCQKAHWKAGHREKCKEASLKRQQRKLRS